MYYGLCASPASSLGARRIPLPNVGDGNIGNLVDDAIPDRITGAVRDKIVGTRHWATWAKPGLAKGA